VTNHIDLPAEGVSCQISGSDNTVSCPEANFQGAVFKIFGDRNTIRIARGTRLHATTFLMTGSGHVIDIGPESVLDGVGVVFEDHDGRLSIGKWTTIHHSAHIAIVEPGRSIHIGDECLFSSHVDIRTSDSHSILDCSTGERINPGRDIRIGHHVWLGHGVAVLKGATIGDHCVIGMRSIVSGDIPAHTAAAGAPARAVRQNITWTHDRR
jgi:acetyltransferase-like isoleucine patch superfamily enzyme